MMYISLEGIPGGGKTSLLNELDAVLGDKAYCLAEHILREQDLNRYIKDVPDSEDAYRLNWLIKSSIVDLFSYKDYVISDRCFITALAYAYSSDKYKYNKPRILFPNTIQWCRHEIRAGRLRKPDDVYILDVNPYQSNLRKHREESVDMLWSIISCIEFANEFYTEILPLYDEFYKNITVIKTDNRSKSEVAKDVSKRILS